jgi:cytochrome c oxidase subunit II
MPPAEALAIEGHQLFLLNGCSACHAINGTEARGIIGPNLTHVGSRLTLGAGIVPNSHDGFIRWIQRTHQVKPGVHMPHFGMLPRHELDALAAYLASLQ